MVWERRLKPTLIANWQSKSKIFLYLVVEKDKDNLAIEEYRDKGVAVKLADASDIEVLKKLKIDKTKHIGFKKITD